jgi:long-chain acyl-CoA synthetase
VKRFALDAHRRPVEVAAGVKLSVCDVGPSEPQGTILFLHGAAGRANHWTAQVAEFSERWRCVAPDMRGHNLSDEPPGQYVLDEFMTDIDALVEAAGLPQRFVVASHSFGGAMGISYAALRPERVEKLVLIATGGHIPLSPSLKFLLKCPSWALDLVRNTMPGRLSCRAAVLQKFIPNAVFPWDGWDRVAAISAPTLVLMGERDHVVPREVSERTASLIPKSEVEIIRHAAHMPLIERPDAVNRAMQRFIEARVTSWRGSLEEPVASVPGAR